MKNLKMLSLLMILAFALSLLAGCGGVKNNFTAEQCVDNGAAQQRWLKDPESHLVLNPAALKENIYTQDARNGAISIGIMDDNNAVKVTLDDVFFMFESKSANGKGDVVVYSPVFTDGDANSTKGLGKLSINNSDGNHFSGSTDTKTADLRFLTSFEIDLDDIKADELFLKVEVKELEYQSDPLYILYTLTPYMLVSEPGITAPGTYLFSLRAAAERYSNDLGGVKQIGITPAFRLLPGITADFTAGIVTFDKGCTEAAFDAKHSWSPWQITTDLSYENGTALHAEDILMGDSVSRRITCKSTGDINVGGKIYGTPSYDSKANKFTFSGDGFNYVVCPKRKGTIVYYDSIEDMKAGVNGAEEYSNQAYWCILSGSSLNTDDSFDVGIAASLTKSADELGTLATDACSASKVNKYKETIIEFWDSYIAANDVSDFIANKPE